MIKSVLVVLVFAVGLLAAQTPAEEAVKLSEEGRFADAAPRFEEAVQGQPKNASLYLGLGLAYQAVKKYSQAIAALEKAVELAPEAPEPYYSLGLLYEAAAADPGIVGEAKAEPVRRGYRLKALKAWETYLRLGQDPKRLGVAKAHLLRVVEANQ